MDSLGTPTPMTQAEAQRMLNADDLPGGENGTGDVQAQATMLFSQYDVNGGGVLDFDEFTKLIAELLCLSGDVLEVPHAPPRRQAGGAVHEGAPRPMCPVRAWRFHGVLRPHGHRWGAH